MTTLQAYSLLLLGRFKCRVLGRHATSVRASRGYVVTWCRRCWGASVERGEG